MPEAMGSGFLKALDWGARMKRSRRHHSRLLARAVVVGLAAIAVAVTACGDSSSNSGLQNLSGTPKPGGTYNFPLGGNPSSIEPVGVYETEGGQVAHQVFEGLVRYTMAADGSMETVPYIAESWKANADATEFTFKLRKDVTFQAPVNRGVTAQDFVDCWNYVTDPANQSYTSYVLAPIAGCTDGGYQEDPTKGLTGVSAPDDYTIVVKLRYPFAEFPTTLGHTVASVWPIDYKKQVGAKAFRSKPVGTGPYLVKKWVQNQYIDLVKNPDWWNKAEGGPFIDTLHMPVIFKSSTCWLDFQKGDLDFAYVPSAQITTSQNMPQVKTGEWSARNWPNLSFFAVAFNWTDKTVGGAENLKLRQALAYGTDREALVNVVMQGLPTPATGIIPIGLPGEGQMTLPYPQDAEKAKQLVQELGSVPDLAYWDVPDPGNEAWDEALQAGWKDVGVKVNLQMFEGTTFYDKLREGNKGSGSQMWTTGWVADYPSVDNFIYPFFDSSAWSLNQTFYSNPTVDDLIEKARGTIDDKARLDLYLQAEKIGLADACLIPLYYPAGYRVTNNRIANFALNPMNFVDMWTLWVK
jgi:oligopeptide transport system substrate-binding protein